MELEATGISVRGPHAPMLHATSLSVADHQVVLLTGYPGAGHVAASLGLSGRLKLDTGSVRLNGKAEPALLRRHVAVVDAPGITEPDDALPVQTVVGEELAVAGRKAGRKAVLEWLNEHDAAEHADKRFEHLPVAVRTRLLTELTVARPDVQMVILTMPDRHGGDPHGWYELGRGLAAQGYGVIITCSDASARLLDVKAARMGETDQPDPVQVTPISPVEPVTPIEEEVETEA
ncbi:hypothetical protein [Kribbella sp. NPDC050459]|uniref:hypothetical protein n=1 Tax=Kribbella sp. NPDC050459 TaxID=3155785 RepID=UPI0033DFCBB8